MSARARAQRPLLVAHVVGEPSRSSLAARDDDVDTGAVQEADRRGVDRGRARPRRSRRAAPSAGAGRRRGRFDDARLLRPARAAEAMPGRAPASRRASARSPAGSERGLEKPSERRELERRAEGRSRGDEPDQRRAHEAINERAAVVFLDPDPRIIDEPAIVDARRARGHAGEAAKAVVDRPDVVGLDLAAGLEQVLDEVDAPARAVALVALGHISRAGRGAEAAMHAGAQDAFEFANVRIGERFGGELGLQAGLRTGVSASIFVSRPAPPPPMLAWSPSPAAQGGLASRDGRGVD